MEPPLGTGTPAGTPSTMNLAPTFFFFDYLDPLSYLVELELRTFESAGEEPVIRVPLELRPPPLPLLDTQEEEWRRRWEEACAAAAVRLTSPALVPWTRKAHELVLHAEAKGMKEKAHRAVFDAVFVEGLDVGRVDVLVGIAEHLGLDPTETKAVLDVDRHAAAVREARGLAATSGITVPPALAQGDRTLRGFHKRDALRTFLSSP
jgi:2-hydroxychromene-2-carboxylate isomerase